MNTSAFLRQIKKLPGYRDQVVHVERLPDRRARYGKLDHPLPPALRTALDGVRDCPCEEGCPSCIQVSINNRQTPEHKGVVLTGRLVLGR